MTTTLPSYLEDKQVNAYVAPITASTITAGTIKAGTIFSNFNAMESQFDGFKFLLENLKSKARDKKIIVQDRKLSWKYLLDGKFQTILTELEVLFKDCQEKNFEGREILLLEMSVFKTKLKKRI